MRIIERSHVVRRASVEDVAAFADNAHRLGLLRDRLRRQADGLGELLVAVDEAPVGFVYLWLDEASEDILRENLPGVPLVMNLWVREEQRRKGFGTALVTAGENRLRELDHDRVALGVSEDNGDAIRLYRRLDYRDWDYAQTLDTVKVVYDEAGIGIESPDICMLMVKSLTTG